MGDAVGGFAVDVGAGVGVVPPVAGGVAVGVGVDPPAAGVVPGVIGSAGAAGVLCAGPCTPLRTELPPERLRMPNPNAPSMNRVPSTAVARVRNVAPARAPKAVWLLEPPNAAAMSPPLPCCSRTTTSNRKQMTT